MFVYNPDHRVVVCSLCRSCIVPGRLSFERHLRADPHRLLGPALKASIELLLSYQARTTKELCKTKPALGDQCRVIDGLDCYVGFVCLYTGCGYATRNLRKIRKHIPSTHQVKAAVYGQSPLWMACKLQTYFTAKGLIDYFVVVDEGEEEGGPRVARSQTAAPTEGEQAYFQELEEDCAKAKAKVVREAGIVHDFEDSRASRVPWLERTGFPSHLKDLLDTEIHSSYKIPVAHELEEEDSSIDDPTLARIIAGTRALLKAAYNQCSDTSANCKMTYQRACILNEFYAGATGRSDAFRSYKLESTRNTYFNTWVQLIVYYYRVVYATDGHFTRRQPNAQVPRDAIEPTVVQQNAFQEVVQAAEEMGEGEDEDDQAVFQQLLQRFFLALICHRVGSRPFRSPVLSFCAALSRTVHVTKAAKGPGVAARGLWKEPGNFNSHLSALTWTAQVVLFDYACFAERESEDQIPVLLRKICQRFFQQLAETPFGHILQWRLYLFQTSKSFLARYQAWWSLDKLTVGYRGIELQMAHIPQLVQSEYLEAQTLLTQDLLFGVDSLVQLQSWKLKDNLDLLDFRESWLGCPENAELVHGTETALLQQIQRSLELRELFFRNSASGAVTFNPKAVDLYEARAQDFLKRMLVLVHITAGQPLREPEILSVAWCNTSRQRHIMIWEKLVMIFTQYHKGQQHTGAFKDNIRFLPTVVGDLLLQFLAYVQPLRQVFLRQRQPAALLSPFLWTTLEGKVWPDGTVSSCLQRACARAQVPQLGTSRWRQISVAICKEKFAARDQAYFAGDDITADDVEDELDLAALALQSNHSVPMFNMAYAGSTTLTVDTLLHRNHRASKLWQDLFSFDAVLQGKRRRSNSNTLVARVQDDIKRSQRRKTATCSEADLLTVARRICSQPKLQFRVPGQRAALLAVLGRCPAEQAVVVLGTGSGKTLIFMVGAALADAKTTILIVPLVALRNDLLSRLRRSGFQPLIWTSKIRRAAPLVVVTVESACTAQFVEYGQRLVNRQQLDRVVVDEAHLTILASDYRPAMVQLGWCLGQIRAPSVWLTATLPPSMQDAFLKQNKLVRPRIVRESTNRPNIEYRVITDSGSVLERAVACIRTIWPTLGFVHGRDKIMVYCNYTNDVDALGEMLGCPTYTAASGTWEDKERIVQAWLADPQQPAIVATSALGPGFDYPYVQWVLHVGAPERLSDFSQASGRAGRAGQPAMSLILLPDTWAPARHGHETPDHAAMELYLAQKHCSRAVLSQFLDAPADWRWCMEGDTPCGVCRQVHAEPRPPGTLYTLDPVPVRAVAGAVDEVLRQDYLRDQALEQYERDLVVMRGTCLYCRAMGGAFAHAAGSCHRRWDWINVKKAVLQELAGRGRAWLQEYVACWRCFQPQSICRVADPEHEESTCQYPDLVLPLCYGVYVRPGGADWIEQHFQRRFATVQAYMVWLGRTAAMEGNECIQANRVAAQAMSEFG